MEAEQIKRIIEALLFASSRPLTVAQIKEVLASDENEADVPAIKMQIEQLKKEYAASQRSFSISHVAGGYQLATIPEYAPWLKKLYRSSRSEKLSRPSLETLSIIAYRQPISRLEIENIRGVNVEGVLKTLLERSLVRISGRKQIPGRPFLYSTSRFFLEFFGLQSVDDLPRLEEFARPEFKITESKEDEGIGQSINESISEGINESISESESGGQRDGEIEETAQKN